MLPTIDFTQQLSQIQAQLQSMNNNPYTPPNAPPVDPKQHCQYRLPCGLCSKTDSFCGMPSEEVKTNE